MEELKKIMRNGVIVAIVILIFGVIYQNIYLYLGMFLGALISVIGFYMICLDAKSSIASGSPFKVSVIGYMKRYIMYGIFLGIMTKYYGFPMLVSGVIGLLNIKCNIYAITLLNTIKNFKKKHSK